MKKLIKQLYDQHLLNNTHSAATKLSYWRLLIWTVSKDIVTASVTILNADVIIISHLHLTLILNQWRTALQEMLIEINQILHHQLLFKL